MHRASRRRLIAALILVLAAALPRTGRAATDCLDLSARAEHRFAIPQGLLQSIALTESGMNGQAWPWVLNIGGAPLYLPNRGQATRDAYLALSRLGDDVAIGCMQLHMHWHARNFENLDDVIDPVVNVWYAARFLVSLHERYGSWVAAVAHYHASDPDAQQVYLCRVLRTRIALGYQTATASLERLCPPG